MIDATRVARMLGEFRRMPAADRGAIIGVLLRVSEMVCELSQIQELDINPLIADAWQRKGLASSLLLLLIEAARERARGQMMGYVMASNRPMLSLCEKLGFSVAADGGDATQMQVTLNL
jgi:ribosomal protein S18 acetylase RimI-like enzyme